MASALSIVKKYFPKVTEVVDATEPIMVEVKKADNNHGKVRDHSACALAVACKRVTRVDGVIISIGKAYLIVKDVATRYDLPESASREIVSFDRNAGFDEGLYKLNKPEKANRLGERQKRKRNDKPNADGSPKTERKVLFRHFTHGVRAALGSVVAPDGIRRTHG